MRKRRVFASCNEPQEFLNTAPKFYRDLKKLAGNDKKVLLHQYLLVNFRLSKSFHSFNLFSNLVKSFDALSNISVTSFEVFAVKFVPRV